MVGSPCVQTSQPLKIRGPAARCAREPRLDLHGRIHWILPIRFHGNNRHPCAKTHRYLWTEYERSLGAPFVAANSVTRFADRVAFVGALLMGLGPIIAGSCSNNFAAVFMTEGVMFGVGQALSFSSAATLPSAYFLKKRNLA